MSEKVCAMDTRDIVELLCDIATEVGSLIGDKGAISVFRYAGKKMGHKIAKAYPGGSVEDARAIVQNFFIEKEFMSSIELQGNDAQLMNCKIGLVLQDRGINIGKHALCNFGFGLIDGVVEAVTQKKIVTLHVHSEQQGDSMCCSETW